MTLTMRDIAKKANVSIATVSRVLNNSGYVKQETRQAVEKIIEKYSYTPNALARSLSKNDMRTVGYVTPDVSEVYFNAVFKGASATALENDVNMLVCDTNNNEEREMKALRMLKEYRVNGAIITPTISTIDKHNDYLRMLENMGIPVVLVDIDVKNSMFDGVFVDNISGAFDATNAFIKCGHKKIAIITGPMSVKGGKDRFEGYAQALAANGLELDKRFVFYGDFTRASGYRMAQRIFEMPAEERPSAVLTCNNQMTLGCMRYLAENGLRIGRDISLISYDDIELFEYCHMGLSAVDSATFEMGRNAIEIVMQRMEECRRGVEKSRIQRVILIPKLILRGSEKLIR